MGIKEFQHDLQNGMTLENALLKHGLTFKQAWELCPKPLSHSERELKNPKRFCRRAGLHIQQRNDKFYLRRTIKGKMSSFGVYTRLEDAIKVRDYMEKNGWSKSKMNEACKKYGIERRV